MKAFLLVCLAIAAHAESDPQILLNQPILPATTILRQPITYLAGQPIVPIKPVEEKKVDVEVESYSAEPEKKVQIQTPLVYTNPLVYNTPLTYGLPVVQQPIVQNVQLLPRYQAKNGEVEHIVAKREAEADPQLLLTRYSSGLVYNTAPVSTPWAYSALPFAYNNIPAVVNQQVINPLAGVTAKTYRNDFHPLTQTYAAKGQYVADSVGARHIAKREAEADPAILYRGLGYNWGAPLRTVYSSSWVRPSVYSSYAPYRYAAYPGLYY